MNFSESEAYLYSLGNEVEAMKLGLENIRRLLTALKEPQKRYIKIQVAGTNGKGSVCAMLDSICRAAGISVGLFTSPHLISITERIRINGYEIGKDDLARLATLVRDTAEDLLAGGELACRPTYFEHLTAMALTAFAEAGIQAAILETGLGGRLDAVTAAESEIAAITNIGLDHQEYLGDTIEQIAREKAAIIHEQTRSVIIGRQKPGALRMIRQRIRELGIPQDRVKDCSAVFNESSPGDPIRELPAETILIGAHQIENAEVAVLASVALRGYFPLSDDDIRKGLQNASHPGRLEYIGNFLLDGAHNTAGTAALKRYIETSGKRPAALIFGAMKEKDASGMLADLAPLADRIVLTKPSNPRALSPEELLAAMPDPIDRAAVLLTEDPSEAVAAARKAAGSGGLILVAGSLYLIGEIRRLLLSA